MIANANPRGHSFAGVTAYLLHDKGAETSERVVFSGTRNLHTDDVEKASRFMAWTDQNRMDLRRAAGGSPAGRKSSKGNVYHYSLSWKPGVEVDEAAMAKVAEETAQRLGLGEHQYYFVAHGDTDHRHVHVVANMVHPETGLVASNYRDHNKLDRWANEYEKAHGIECEQRAKKYEEWERGKRAFGNKERRSERKQAVTEAFHGSDSGQAFKAALDDGGMSLARGAKRGLVVVDQDGEIFALNRLIDLSDGTTGRAKSKLIAERLADVDKASLEEADSVAAKRKSFDRDAAEVAQQKALADGADKAAEAKAKEAAAKETAQRERQRAAELSERQVKWRALQRSIDRKTAAAREKWQLDELAKKRDEARADVEAYKGFFSRVFRRKQIAQAADRLSDYEQRLSERTDRFRADVEAFNAQRPAWLQERELARHGLAQPAPPPPPPKPTLPESSQPSPSAADHAREQQRQQAALELLARARERERQAQEQQQRQRDSERDRGPEPGR